MNKSQKYLNTISFLVKYLWLILVILSILITIFITTCSPDLSFFKPDFGHLGWSFFIKAYTVPLSLIGLGIPIYGILVALYRLYQSEEQFEVYKHNIYMSNYYRHMDEFLNMIENYVNSFDRNRLSDIKAFDKFVENNLTKDHSRKLYQLWYGTRFDSKHKISNDMYSNIGEFYKRLLTLETNQDNIDVVIQLGCKLGFNQVPKVRGLHTDFGIIIDVCERILNFSDENKPENSDKVYKLRKNYK